MENNEKTEEVSRGERHPHLAIIQTKYQYEI